MAVVLETGKNIIRMSMSLTRLQSFYSELKTPLLLHALITREFPGTIGLLTSFGADAGLLAMAAEIDPAMPVLFLNTGKHFPETLSYVRDLTLHLRLSNVHWLAPDPEALLTHDPKGSLWDTAPDLCCRLRKVEPLARAVEAMGLLALITGRSGVDLERIELDDNGVFRINPLARWTKEEQNGEMAKRNIPAHPLMEKGYGIIGCAPCTLPAGANGWAQTIGLEGESKADGIRLPASETGWSV